MVAFIAKAIAKKLFKPSKSTLLKFLAIILIIPSILFTTLSLTGCISTSPQIPNLYIVSLTNTNSSSSSSSSADSLEIRLGFFGICGINPSSNESTTICTPISPTPDISTLFPSLSDSDAENEATQLLTTALTLQKGIFPYPLAAGTVAFVLSLLFVLIHKRSLKKAEFYSKSVKWIKRITFTLLVIAVAGTGGSALAITQAADVLEYVSLDCGMVGFQAGKTVQVFQWIAVGCELVFLLLVPGLVKPREEEVYYDKEYV
ncbi:Ca2+ regulator and membrane fusion protein Fig1-domain-containing protein [Podospora fimiseda]|uniref:Ca2+ regulator and membrane fusion protein Fig1-domain-containing protein n=1 Tax=Podospora fimiseda TaxID=252190 RepID=A0AAN7BLN4_9PEZI|nr:Ca2+ regulator and membrane fusion protein Fig1-domain-containing protein [Podospora fimiseda]